jgi:hypothetical protein
VFSRNYHTLHSHLLLLQYKPTHKDNDHCFSCSVLQYKPTRNSFSCSVLPLNLFSPSIQTRTQLLLLLLQSKLSCIFRSISLRGTKWFQTVFSPWINLFRNKMMSAIRRFRRCLHMKRRCEESSRKYHLMIFGSLILLFLFWSIFSVEITCFQNFQFSSSHSVVLEQIDHTHTREEDEWI